MAEVEIDQMDSIRTVGTSLNPVLMQTLGVGGIPRTGGTTDTTSSPGVLKSHYLPLGAPATILEFSPRHPMLLASSLQ